MHIPSLAVQHAAAHEVARAALLAALLVALGAAAWHDIRARRVPNGLVAAIALGALGAGPLALSPAGSLPAALLGGAVGLGCWLPAWWRGALGAGDVKLFAAAGVWLGPALAWRSAVVAALLGGAFAAALLAWRRYAPPRLLRSRTLAPDLPDRGVPYAVPMAIALALAAALPRAFPFLP